MAINLFEAVKQMKVTTFKFIATEKVISGANAEEGKELSFYLRLQLEKPIEVIKGSKMLFDPNNSTKVPQSAFDVEYINVYADKLEKYSEEFTDLVQGENGSFSGTYSGDMFFDVASSDEVWLTDVKFSKLSSEYGKERRLQRVKSITDRLAGNK